jgi:hypothetical protein
VLAISDDLFYESTEWLKHDLTLVLYAFSPAVSRAIGSRSAVATGEWRVRDAQCFEMVRAGERRRHLIGLNEAPAISGSVCGQCTDAVCADGEPRETQRSFDKARLGVVSDAVISPTVNLPGVRKPARGNRAHRQHREMQVSVYERGRGVRCVGGIAELSAVVLPPAVRCSRGVEPTARTIPGDDLLPTACLIMK